MGTRRIITASVCVLLASCIAAPSNAADRTPASRFTASDVFGLKTVGDVRISPDGQMIAYEALEADIMTDRRQRSIRIIDVATGSERLLARGGSAPRWSPDSRWLAYNDHSGTADRLMIVSPTGATPRVLASFDGPPSAVTWSRDGLMMAFTRFVATTEAPPSLTPPQPAGARWAPPPRVITTVRHDEDGAGIVSPGQTQLFVIAASGGVPLQLTKGLLDVSGDPSWMPDGGSLVYSAVDFDHFGDGFHSGRLYRVSSRGGQSSVLTGTDLAARSPSVSPDGRRVAFVAWAVDGRDFSPVRLRLLDLESRRSRVLEAALDRDFNSVVWSADGRRLYAGYADRSIDKVRRIDVDGVASTDVAAGLGGDFTIADDGTVAFPFSRSDRPTEVALARSSSPTAKVLTQRNEPLLREKTLGETVPLVVTSALDSASVGAWLTRPADYVAGRAYPMILDIHGGPYGYDGPVWRTRDQLFAAAGYAVLHVNYRGSTSYGFAFADRIAADKLAPSYADLMSAVDAAIKVGVADPRRLFVTGGSAGGELTAWIVGHTDRFRAAMAEKPIINSVSRTLTSDQYYITKLIAGPAPWEDAVRQWSLSPLAYVGRVTTPTMLIVGEEDRRTPPAESLQFYHALKLRGVPTALALFPEASHASLGARPSQLTAIVKLTIDWFEQH